MSSRGFLQLIRFSHTIFALPFALGALLVAADGRPTLRTLLLVLACMVLARTAAMLFNRLCDWSLDQKNPRTANRHRLLEKSIVWALLAINSVGFLITSAAINRDDRSPRSGRPADHFLLLADEAVHERDPLLSRPGARGCARRRLDCANRPARFAAPGPGRRGYLLGGRLRPDLRDAGCRLRSTGRVALAGRQTWASRGACGWRNGFMSSCSWRSSRLVSSRNWGRSITRRCRLVAAALFYEHRSASKLDLAGINRAFFQSNAFVSAIFVAAVAVDRWW